MLTFKNFNEAREIFQIQWDWYNIFLLLNVLNSISSSGFSRVEQFKCESRDVYEKLFDKFHRDHKNDR